MKQKIISKVQINYYSTKKLSIEMSSVAKEKETIDIQLLLISVLNFINTVYSLKKNSEGILSEIKSINQELLNSDDKANLFVKTGEIIEKTDAKLAEYFVLSLVKKGNSIFLEADSRDIANPFYKYSSIRSLFQEVLNKQNEELTIILNESLNYIFEYYSKSNYGELKSLLELSHYFTNLFAEFLVT